MFCASNDTTLVWNGLACSEKPSPDENNNLWSKSWSSHSHKVNATYLTETLRRHLYDVLRFQWHHTRLKWTRLLREDLSRRKQQFMVKTWKSHSHKLNATYSTETLKWNFYDVLRFQWHHTRLKWNRPLREDLSRRKQQFLVKMMKLAFTQSKRDIFNWDS